MLFDSPLPSRFAHMSIIAADNLAQLADHTCCCSAFIVFQVAGCFRSSPGPGAGGAVATAVSTAGVGCAAGFSGSYAAVSIVTARLSVATESDPGVDTMDLDDCPSSALTS